MSQRHEATSFAQKKDELIRKIEQLPTPDKIRDHFKRDRNSLETLYRASVREVRGFEEHDNLETEFADAVIGDGLEQARAKIFAAVLQLTTDPATEIWTCFIAALALTDPSARRDDFRDECIPDIDINYIKNHLGETFAAALEQELCVVSPPIVSARRGYETETWTMKRDDADDEWKEQRRKYNEPTGHFWPDQAALKIAEDHKELLRAFYIEHSKCSAEYTVATPVEMRYKLRQARRESDAFLIGVQDRARILAILLYNRVPREQAWDVFIGACMSRSEHMLDEHLPYTPDDINQIFGTSMRQGERDSFHHRQFSFCPLKIGRPSSHRPEIRIPLERAHMPFEWKKKCGEGASNVAVFYVGIHEGHLQEGEDGNDKKDEQWNRSVTRLAMKQIPYDKYANQEVKVNMLIHDQPLKHDHIIQIRGIHWLADAVLIFMDPAQCNLYEFMTVHCKSPAASSQSRKTRLRMITRIADALVYLHSRLEDDSKIIHFMHKDLKAENILVVGDNDITVETKDLKLTDFGLSSVKAESSSASGRGPETVHAPADRTSRTRLPANAVNFAPEASNNNAVTKKSDVWAFGIGLAEYVAWIARGSEGLEDLKRKRNAYEHPSWVLDENKKPVLSPAITEWFEHLTADGQLSDDEKQMYTSCWLLLKHVCLVCVPERRGCMEDVQKFLRNICNGSTTVQASILSDFPLHRLNGMQTPMGYNEDAQTRVPEFDTDIIRYDSARDVSDTLARESIGSGRSLTAAHNSTDFAISLRPSRSNASRVAPEEQTHSPVRRFFGRLGFRSASADPPRPGDPAPIDSRQQRRATTMSNNVDVSREHQDVPPRVTVAEHGHQSANGPKKTELHLAADAGDFDLVRSLLEQIDSDTEQGRAQVNAEDEQCMTPLLYALRSTQSSDQGSDVRAAMMLLAKGADVSIIPNHRRSALHYAVAICPPDTDECLTALLLQQSPGLIMQQDENGNTPLHNLADGAMKGTLERLGKMVEVLKKTQEGASALDQALRLQNRSSRYKQGNYLPCEMVRDDRALSGDDRRAIIALLRPGRQGFSRTMF
ncbi:protein kinase [Venturia nashicola]|nr:protein kinase [Venturia nashicola]